MSGTGKRAALVNAHRVLQDAATLFVGKLVSRATIIYDVPALEPGTYFFRCDLHPDMRGTLIVTD